MGFFKKIFRKKKKPLIANASSSSDSNVSSRRKLSRKEKKALKAQNQTGSFDSNRPQSSDLESRTRPSSSKQSPSSRNGQHNNGHSGPTGLNGDQTSRKPPFVSQREVHVGLTNSISSGTLSPNESRSPRSRRSPHSYEDSREREDVHQNNMRHNASPRDNYSPREHQQQQQQHPQHRNGNKNGMVVFEGENAFNDDRESPRNYTNYSQNQIHNQRPSPSPANSRQSPISSPLSNLQYEQVQRMEQQNQLSHQHQHHPYQNQPSKKMLQIKRLPNGEVTVMDHNRLDSSSPLSVNNSEFDLSTDAEDNEYNHIRQTSSAIKQPMLPIHSPSSESENSHHLVDPMRQFDHESGNLNMSRSRHYFSDSDHDTMNSPATINSHNTDHNGENNPNSRRSSPAQDTIESNEHNNEYDNEYDNENNQHHDHTNQDEYPNDNPNKGKSRFSFDNEFEEMLVRSKRPNHGEQRPPSPTAFQKINTNHKTPRGQHQQQQIERGQSEDDGSRSHNSAISPRALAIQAAHNMRTQGKSLTDLYPDSTDSEMEPSDHNNKARNMKQRPEDMLPPRTSRSQESESIASSQGRNEQRGNNRRRNEGVIENFADFETFANNEFGRGPSKSKSVADATSPVSELLAQAQARRKNRANGNYSASGAPQSVNSEPALNAAMLRQQMKNTRQGSQSSSEAMKKLAQRRMEKEKFLQLLNDGKNNNLASEDETSDREKDVNESWLFDEVTGALGPRGITADLESLGERSNKSKTSIGNKSHRSHRSHRSNRSYRSHKSSTSHRRGGSGSAKRSSDESVGSRHSRGSRYSVRSTKSHVSQMSQESRSVANDLIRLEMQLAMVNKNGENEVKKQLELDAQRKGLKDGISVGESSIGVSSYASRKRNRKSKMTIPKRAKTTVKAPPGKLGIILANRTDSKGTVVSGVRTTSVLADKISPGDRIILIDGEDVSRMSVPEITSIMARKNDFERVLTVLITPQK